MCSARKGYLSTHQTVTVKSLVNGKPMHDFLFAMADDYTKGMLSLTNLDSKIAKYLSDFTEQGNITASDK
ncbi:MAG: hypothetical protein J0H85_13740 [Sediminibacterium magnilacihabitans]|nr:hypothetical protein [Sediminibacterium magnilacihabitans]